MTIAKYRDRNPSKNALNSKPQFHKLIYLIQHYLIYTIYLLIPVSFYSCSYLMEASVPGETEPKGTRLLFSSHGGSGATIEDTLDIFAFNDDKLMRLDSYTRTMGYKTDEVSIATQAGNKIVFICTGLDKRRSDWALIDCYQTLREIRVSLEDEKSDALCMTAECHIKAGKDTGNRIELQPVASQVVLSSIKCDFTDKGYAECNITDVRVYLLNVNAQSTLINDGIWNPERILNHGHLDEDDLTSLAQPSLLLQELDEDISKNVMRPDIRLLCYPNNSSYESPGSPFTRLVIEGKINGTAYYWPININRPPYGDGGIERNCRYEYDIVIRNKGNADPDTPVETDDISMNVKVTKWKEIEEYPVRF